LQFLIKKIEIKSVSGSALNHCGSETLLRNSRNEVFILVLTFKCQMFSINDNSDFAMSAVLKSSCPPHYAAATTAPYATATAGAYAAATTPSYSHATIAYNSNAYAAAVSPVKPYAGFNHDYSIPPATVPLDSTTPTVVRSPSVKPAIVSSRHAATESGNRHTAAAAAESGNRHGTTAAESGSTPRPSGQRCLPETPRAGPTTAATAAAPIYANLEAGNSRNAAQVSRLLEEGARMRTENPPAIPRPAARLSLRQKVLDRT
jgi:hypothetical protein